MTSDGNRTLIVLVKAGYGLSSIQFTADAWSVSDGRLTLADDGTRVGEFADGQWIAVADDDHRQPDLGFGALLAARRALENIARECGNGRQASISFIARLARDGLLEASTGEMTEP